MMTEAVNSAAPGVAPREAALAAYQRHDPDAPGLIAAALAARPLDGGLLIADATLAQEAGRPDALDRLSAVLATAPDWLDGQVALAGLRWGAGDRERFLAAFEAALDKLPGHAGLWVRYMTLLADSGGAGRAAEVAARLRRTGGDAPALRLLEARYAGLAGDAARAGALLADLPEDTPDRLPELARHWLRVGDPDRATPLLDRARGEAPDDVRLWAMTELAWRAAGDPRHAWLVQPGMIEAMTVDLDEATLSRLADRLRALHGRRWPPLGQSVRDGTQTRGDLRLLADDTVRIAFRALQAAVARYGERLPPVDPKHPLFREPGVAFGIANAWSIRIDGAGRHVSHVHPAGVLSSAFYVVVPPTLDHAVREGWLELGRPPADMTLELEPVAAVQPVPGRLAVFPSYLYHGTRPFKGGERMSVAFDMRRDRAADDRAAPGAGLSR